GGDARVGGVHPRVERHPDDGHPASRVELLAPAREGPVRPALPGGRQEPARDGDRRSSVHPRRPAPHQVLRGGVRLRQEAQGRMAHDGRGDLRVVQEHRYITRAWTQSHNRPACSTMASRASASLCHAATGTHVTNGAPTFGGSSVTMPRASSGPKSRRTGRSIRSGKRTPGIFVKTRAVTSAGTAVPSARRGTLLAGGSTPSVTHRSRLTSAARRSGA